jgi:hypothetical protein
VIFGASPTKAALFERIDVRGFRDVTLHLTDEALSNGFGVVLPERFGISVSGRGERDSPSLTQRSVPFLLINRTPPREPVERTA